MNQRNLKDIFSSTTLSLLLVTSYAHAHSGHLNEKAVSVCENKVRSDTCQYEGGHHDLYIGSCQYMSTTLMCVRNQPIQQIDSTETTSDHHHQDE